MKIGELERFTWRSAAVCGLLFGIVIVMAVTLSQPIGQLRLSAFVMWVVPLSLAWTATGLCWAFGAKFAEDFGRPRLVIALLPFVAWIVSIAGVSVLSGAVAPGNFDHVLNKVPLLDLCAYVLWVNLFYGGLYILGYFSSRRTQRLRQSLAMLRASRDEAEAKLREVRLQAVRGQIQPAMLLDALTALQRIYAADRAAGDRMFDLLIAFLRAAMPGLRSGTSTLAAELTVVDRYATLRDALDVGSPIWRLNVSSPVPDLPFPPLRLLPALDRMSRAAPTEASVEVTAMQSAEDFVLRIGAPTPQPLPATLIQSLRDAMHRDLGGGGHSAADLAGSLIAELRFSSPWTPAFLGVKP